MRIVLIGAGNVGWHIGERLAACGVTPVQVFSRTMERAHALAGKLSTRFVSNLNEISDQADIYIIAAPDDAIPTVSKIIQSRVPEGAVVAHTSGSVSTQALSAHKLHGVFYPLQTFSAGRPVDWDTIPLLITAGSDDALLILSDLAKTMRCPPQIISDKQRAILHLAATIACNFSNHMYRIAHGLLQENDLDFALLKPLIKETAQKVQETEPQYAQTGPAIRGDQKTLQQHMAKLHGNPQLAILYALISKHIQTTKETDQQ